MQNNTFVTAFSANFDDRLAKFGLKIHGAVKIIVAQKLQEFCYSTLQQILGYVGESVPEVLLT
jgi:hypothetical protein